MSLLVDMMTNTLDESYADRARRPAADSSPEPSPRPRGGASGVLPVVVLLLLGVLTGTAVAQVRDRQEASTGLRAELAGEVRARTDESDDLASRTEVLREEVTAVREAALGADETGRRLTERLELLGLASGTLPVEGPGLVVTVSDAPDGAGPSEDPLSGAPTAQGLVQDRDLQEVVNGLWAVGAEAVAVNGQRLTALTAIRNAGEAVLVDLRPLTPPYVIEAVGDPEDLEVDFLDGPTGRGLANLTARYGIVVDVRRDEELSLPGAAAPDLPVSRPAPDESGPSGQSP